MMNLRSRSKARATAARAASKMEPMILGPSTASDGSDLSEAALRKLPRSELQKLAMAHKVKANTKSELIIRQLSRLRIAKRERPAEGDPEEGPLRKKPKRESGLEKASISPKNQAAPSIDAQPSQVPAVQSNARDLQPPEAGPSAPRLVSQEQQAPVALPYERDLFSGTESEMTEEEQLDFATPVSSRAETPPPANVNDLKRCAMIMQKISGQDVDLLKEVTAVRETATKLRKKARDVRDLVKAEGGRRERMEAYFRYWQEIGPNWDRGWLYGEKAPDREDRFTGGERPSVPEPKQRQTLSPEELKKKRQAIISKQEAEQRQLELEASRGQGVRVEHSSEEGSGRAADDSCGGADLLSTEEKDAGSNAPLRVMPYESDNGTNAVSALSL